ncbi:MAG: hypothetical protein ACI4MI_04645 [Christensenellales bacterium]
MKKSLVILLLGVCLLTVATGGVCMAETAPYYVVNNATISQANSLALYADDDGSPADFVACYIPPTYYFQSAGTVQGDYTMVTYNGVYLWAKTLDIASKSAIDNSGKPIAEDNAYYSHNIAVNPQLIEQDLSYVIVFYDTSLTNNNTGRTAIFTNDIDNITFIGLNEINSKVYYYVSVKKGSDTIFGFIDPSSTDVADITYASITIHPNSVVEPDEDVPTIDTPTIETPASNNLVRNILIAVICVLCVVIVFLIFRPTRKAG